jgi:glycosyltransferase involved in cell wall biosynthesis
MRGLARQLRMGYGRASGVYQGLGAVRWRKPWWAAPGQVSGRGHLVKTLVHYVDGDGFGGTEQVVLQLLQGIDSKRWRSMLVHHDHEEQVELIKRAEDLGVSCHVVPKVLRAKDLLGLPPFVRRLRELQPAVFHAHLTWPLSCKYGILAAVLAGVPRIIATAHLAIEPGGGWPTHVQPRWIARGVSQYVAVSASVERQLVEEFGIPAEQVTQISNGVDVTLFDRPVNPQLRAELSQNEERRVLACIGRLDAQKGQRYLIEAMADVPETRAVLVGEGPDRGDLERLSETLGVTDRVTFLGQRSDVPDVLAACDALVLPSLCEGLPLAILEAMAAGKPVIASNNGGNAEAVVDNKTGMLVPVGNSAGLADAIRQMLADPQRAERMGESGRQRTMEYYTQDRMLSAMAALYDAPEAAQ